MTNSPLDVKFRRALHEVLNFEGGYVNNSKDPGGATNRGITQREYDSWRRRHGLPLRAVAVCTPEETESIYREDFWNQMECDLLSYPVALMAFDTAVQWGVHGAAEMLKTLPIVQTLPASFPTLGKRLAACEPRALVEAIYAARAAFRVRRVKEKPSQLVFLRGWKNRDSKLRDLALKALPSSPAK